MSATVMVVGLGDLGGRILDLLAREPRIGRLVGASRDVARGEATCGQAALVAALRGGVGRVEFERLDLDDEDETAAVLARVAPDAIVTAAAGYAWWHPADPALGALPYVAWLPLLITPIRGLMRARAAAGVTAPVVSLTFPDAVGPALAPAGLAPELGAGNVAEVAAKLGLLAARDAGVPRADVDVRLVLHHAVERIAFGTFASLGAAPGDGGEPPWHAEVRVRGEALAPDRVDALLRAPYPLQPGRASQQLTAASAAAAVCALLDDEPTAMHVPAPHGRPGGYPVHVSRSGVTLDLPAGLEESDAVSINERAAAWDGIEAVEPDGTVVLSATAAATVAEVLGWRSGRLAPDDHVALAAELAARLGRG
jgi:hypothetical protein